MAPPPTGVVRVLAILLLVGGVAGLAYGGFSYTRSTSTTSIGPIAVTVQDRRTMTVPIWAGVAAILLGAGLMFVPPMKEH
jgi:drug/metabolite transporter (DMT)-like permease